MTKYELLNILYAERKRVEKNYTRPGWTLWAIGAAIASMGWLAWSFAEQCSHWRYAVMMFYLLYFAGNMIDALTLPFRTQPQIPIWTKKKGDKFVQILLHIFAYMGMILFQLVFIPRSFCPWLYWASLVVNIIMLILMFWVINILYKGLVIYEKHEEGISWFFIVFAPSFLLCTIYMLKLAHDPIAVRLGTICYAIFFLLSLAPFGQKKVYFQIDRLISTVLYEREEVDEKEVLQELELYTIGLRYGKYLSQMYMKDYISRITNLMNCSKRLVFSIKTNNRTQMDSIIQEGQKEYQELKALEWKNISALHAVYSNKNADYSYQPILSASKVGIAIMEFWEKEIMLKDASGEDIMLQIKDIYNQTIGLPEIQKLIDDDSLWVYSISGSQEL